MPYEYTDCSPVNCSIQPDLSTLKGKSVIITGGSSGLGASYVDGFLKAGAFVTNVDLNSNGNQEGKSNYQFSQCDVTIWDQQVATFKAALSNSPDKTIDIVIANAGMGEPDSVYRLDDTDEPPEPSLKIILVDLIAVVYTAKLAMHYFNKQDSSRDKCLILKASLAGYLDLPGETQYQVSKYGVRGLMCNLRRAGRCRVNLVAPWFVRTPALPEPLVKAIDETMKKHGAGWATIEDCTRAMLLIAADSSVHGRALAVVPHAVSENGYIDVNCDDNEGNDRMKWLQQMVTYMHGAQVPADKK